MCDHLTEVDSFFAYLRLSKAQPIQRSTLKLLWWQYGW